jgi:adenylate kinase family enzyme
MAAVEPVISKPTAWSLVRSAFSVGKVLMQDVAMWSDDFFDGDEWTEPYSSDFTQVLLDVLQKLPYERMRTTSADSWVRLTKLSDGTKVGWIFTNKDNHVTSIYVESSRKQEARSIIKQLLWKRFGSQSLIMRRNRTFTMGVNHSHINFTVDDAFETKRSDLATQYAAYLKRPLDAGVPRAVMFYGPPGTGKSTTARTICELLGLRSFRIRIGDLDDIDNSTLFDAIDIFEPDAVILDDFDRASAQAQLLETLEHFEQKVKLVIVTVNDRAALDPALLRPGRIDELIEVKKMDDDVIKHVLGDYADGFDHVKDWPIAFINEYVIRRRFMSSADAAKALEELAWRVKSMLDHSDGKDDDLRLMLKHLKDRKAPAEHAAREIHKLMDDAE